MCQCKCCDLSRWLMAGDYLNIIEKNMYMWPTHQMRSKCRTGHIYIYIYYLGNRKYAKKMYLLEKPGFSKQIRFLINLAPKAHLGSLDIICILWLPKPMRHAASPWLGSPYLLSFGELRVGAGATSAHYPACNLHLSLPATLMFLWRLYQQSHLSGSKSSN